MDINKLMAQAQAMQKNLEKTQSELEQTEYIGTSGGDDVKIVMNGKNEIQSIEIADDLMDLENKEMLQDLLLIAINNAVEEAAKDKEDKLGGITGGLSIPGM